MRTLLLYILPILLLAGCGTKPKPTYQLTVNVEPEEAGIVNFLAKDEYEKGETLGLTAVANEHWVFTEWAGAANVPSNSISIEINSDKIITALFEKLEYPLDMLIEGEGSVSQRVIQTKTDYKHGTAVELTATPEAGWDFIEWTGGLTGSENPGVVTIDGSTTVTAIFIEKEVTLDIETEGNGTVDKRVVQNKAVYDRGTEVELSAMPDEEWLFYKWQGDLTGNNNPVVVELDNHKSIKAIFLTEQGFAEQLASSEFYPTNIIGGNIWNAAINFRNEADENILLEEVNVYTWGSPSAEIGETLEPGDDFGLGLTFNGYHPPLEEFLGYTVEWTFVYNDNSYILTGTAQESRNKSSKNKVSMVLDIH